MKIDFAPAWRRHVRAHSRGSMRPIVGTLRDERPMAFLISTATRDRVWLPKKLVTHNAVTGVFMMPSWLAAEKLLD
jgi:hypothetical protein